MSQILAQFVHPIFDADHDMLIDGAGVRWLSVLSKDGHGTNVYKQQFPYDQHPLELVIDNGSWHLAKFLIGHDGNLHTHGGNGDGTITISDPVPGYTPVGKV